MSDITGDLEPSDGMKSIGTGERLARQEQLDALSAVFLATTPTGVDIDGLMLYSDGTTRPYAAYTPTLSDINPAIAPTLSDIKPAAIAPTLTDIIPAIAPTLSDI